MKPTTDIVLFAGFALGAVPGFAVGAVDRAGVEHLPRAGSVDRLADGGVGRGRGGGRRYSRGPRRSGSSGGCRSRSRAGSPAWPSARCSTSTRWTLAARQDLATYMAVSGTSLPYNLAHAIGNVGLLPPDRPRLHPRAAALPAPVRGALAPGGRGGGRDAARVRRHGAAASPASKATRYLERAQNQDGGFGGGEGPALERAVHGLGGARARLGAPQPARRGAQGRPFDHPVHAREQGDLRHGRAAADDPGAEGRRHLAAALPRAQPGGRPAAPPGAATGRGGRTSRSPPSACWRCAPAARAGLRFRAEGRRATWSAARTPTAASASWRAPSPTRT